MKKRLKGQFNSMSCRAHDIYAHLGIKKCCVCAQDFATFARLLDLSKKVKYR